MKIITISPIKNVGGKGTSFVANVNGFEGATAFAKNEIDALEYLLNKLKERHSKFIQRSDWTWSEIQPTEDGQDTQAHSSL